MSDHPRVCGELLKRSLFASAPYGSSPRVRGTPGPAWWMARKRRIIPACAGNSSTADSPRFSMTDHPRVCGELGSPPTSRSNSYGSSPRVRGTHRAPGERHAHGRIIPACAGNSTAIMACALEAPDHPRVCGELPKGPVAVFCGGGSSPRVRGTLRKSIKLIERRRIIPACAGNSGAARRRRARDTDHPRVCGELARPMQGVDGSTGSSPRVRGTRCCKNEPHDHLRIIPACAGNSGRPANRRQSRPDHPRVCGELAGLPAQLEPGAGSSPRVRGTQVRLGMAGVKVRIIPACAGNS